MDSWLQPLLQVPRRRPWSAHVASLANLSHELRTPLTIAGAQALTVTVPGRGEFPLPCPRREVLAPSAV